MAHETTKFVEWVMPEFTYKEKSVDWYWALGIIVVVGFVIAIVTKNFITALLILLAGGLLFFFARKEPDDIVFEMSDQGIRVDDSMYPYHNLKSFWLGVNTHGEPILFLHIDRIMTPLLIVPVHPDVDQMLLREVLLEYLPEVEHREPIAHILSDRVGF